MDVLNIKRSRTRQKLLAHFFTNPNSNLYVREIASILSEDPGNISKELYRLENAGIFTSYKRGNQKHYSVNKKSPLYSELRSIIFKTIGVNGALKDMINSMVGIELSFIYGSFAQNKENSASDIDLLIVGKPDEDRLIQKIESLEKRLQREINYNIYSSKEFQEKFMKKDSFIVNIIKRRKILLKGSINEIC
ncbi:MAG: nucleotidyltransferase domain-containing protein [Candidatus Omnitrophica bacterium]|nr:nucleotidyltransferase domain-containing protein [Candidatus Omnitrophota bacterium]